MKHRITLILLFSLTLNISAAPQKKDANNRTKRDELSLAEESYKASLMKLLEVHENELKQAKAILETRRRQYERGEITRDTFANTEKFVAEAESRVTRTKAEISKLEIVVHEVSIEIPPYNPAKAQKRGVSSSVLGYTTVPFDINKEKLPEFYRGHNIVTLYQKMVAKIGPKSEFESTDAYTVRLKPMLQSETYAFYYLIEPTYDADSEIMQVFIWPTTVSASEMSRGLPLPKKASLLDRVSKFIIKDANERVNYYYGSNSFGIRKRVRRSVRDSYGIAVQRNFDRIRFNLSLTPEKARRLKPYLGALLIGKVDISDLVPQVAFLYVDSSTPTITNPEEYMVTYKIINFNLQEIWLYDIPTGTIIEKRKFDQ